MLEPLLADLDSRSCGKAVGETGETTGVDKSSACRYAAEAAGDGVQDQCGSRDPAG